MHFEKENLKKLMSMSDEQLVKNISQIMQFVGKDKVNLELDSEKLNKIKAAASQLSEKEISDLLSRIDPSVLKSLIDNVDNK